MLIFTNNVIKQTQEEDAAYLICVNIWVQPP